MSESQKGLANAVRRATGSLRLQAGNPRTHGKAQIDKICRSIEAFGWTAPILIDEAGEIVAGEARWRAAQQLGLAEVPCIVLLGLTALQRRAYRVADNRLALDAGWDDALLAQVMHELSLADFDLDLTGFDDGEIGKLLEPLLDAPPASADQAAAPPAVPRTQLGDIWRLGQHRLICGDSTDPATIGRLLDSDRARLVATDPPYGMEYEARAEGRVELVATDPPYGMSYGGGQDGKFGMILGDDARGDELVDLVAGALQAARPHTRKGAAWYVCLTWRTYSEFARAMARAELPIAACIVWDKGSPGLGYQHYRPQHEFILYSAGDRWHGEHAERDVWSFTRGNTGEYVHPTQKPVALLERMVRNSSRVGDVVLDLFGGSGSTLIACERLDRRARLVELDPRYCDAIVRRWEKITGKTAEREGP